MFHVDPVSVPFVTRVTLIGVFEEPLPSKIHCYSSTQTGPFFFFFFWENYILIDLVSVFTLRPVLSISCVISLTGLWVGLRRDSGCWVEGIRPTKSFIFYQEWKTDKLYYSFRSNVVCFKSLVKLNSIRTTKFNRVPNGLSTSHLGTTIYRDETVNDTCYYSS